MQRIFSFAVHWKHATVNRIWTCHVISSHLASLVLSLAHSLSIALCCDVCISFIILLCQLADEDQRNTVEEVEVIPFLRSSICNWVISILYWKSKQCSLFPEELSVVAGGIFSGGVLFACSRWAEKHLVELAYWWLSLFVVTLPVWRFVVLFH